MTGTGGLVNVRRDDLELLLKVCACYAPYPLTDDISVPVDRILAALRVHVAEKASPALVCPSCGSSHVEFERGLLFCGTCGATTEADKATGTETGQ